MCMLTIYELHRLFIDIVQDRYIRREISKHEFEQQRNTCLRQHSVAEAGGPIQKLTY